MYEVLRLLGQVLCVDGALVGHGDRRVAVNLLERRIVGAEQISAGDSERAAVGAEQISAGDSERAAVEPRLDRKLQ
jgi:hypothetical protein